MSFYRCAMCGSRNIVEEVKQEGYNRKKGIWGAALFGGIGALAGTSGKTVTYYHCRDCGQVLNRTMPKDEQITIEKYLQNPTIYADYLREKKREYKNLEWDESAVTSLSKSNTVPSVQEIENRMFDFLRSYEFPYSGDLLAAVGFSIKEIGEKYADELFGRVFDNVDKARDNLLDSGRIKLELIGEQYYFSVVRDPEEMKQLIEQRKIEKIKEDAYSTVRKLVKVEDYISVVRKALLKESMSSEEIYTYLKNNNYLDAQILAEAEKNPFIPDCLIEKIVEEKYSKGKYGMQAYYYEYNLFACENEKYRSLTENEIQEQKACAIKECIDEIDAHIDKYIKLVTCLNEKGPMFKSEILSRCDVSDDDVSFVTLIDIGILSFANDERITNDGRREYKYKALISDSKEIKEKLLMENKWGI